MSEKKAAETKPRKKYSLRRKEEPFDVETEDGRTLTYVMREMDGALRDEYLTVNNQRISTKDGQTTVTDFTGLYAALLSRCVFDENNRPVSEAAMQAWPAGVQEEVFKDAMVMNGLDKDAKAAAKNA